MGLLATVPPDGITCTDWERGERREPSDIGDCPRCGRFDDLFDSGESIPLCSRCTGNPGCRFFVEAQGHGACAMPSRFMCMEWEKGHGTPSSASPTAPNGAATAAKAPGVPQDALGGPGAAAAGDRPAEPNLVAANLVLASVGTPEFPFVAGTTCPAPGCGKLQGRTPSGWVCSDNHGVGAPSWQVCSCGHEYPDHPVAGGSCRGRSAHVEADSGPCPCTVFRRHMPKRDLFGEVKPDPVDTNKPPAKGKRSKAKNAPGESPSTESATSRRYTPITRAVAAVPRWGRDGEAVPVQPLGETALIDPSWVAALEKANCEVKVETSAGGAEVVLVPARTDRQDRTELTFREGLVLSEILRAFPGARITSISKGPEPEVDELDEDAFE